MNFKRKALITLIILLITTSINAQTCKPDPSVKNPGYYPSVLQKVYIDSNHQQTLTVMVPKDTTVVVQGNTVKAIIDSILVLEIIGLPAGFTWKCNNSACSFYPNISGCVLLTGKANKSQEGKHPLKIVVRADAKVIGLPLTQNDTIEAFELNVVDKSTSINKIEDKNFYFNADKNTMVFKNLNAYRSMSIIDMKGSVVFKSNAKGLTLKVPQLAPGVYNAILTNKDKLSYIKFIIK